MMGKGEGMSEKGFFSGDEGGREELERRASHATYISRNTAAALAFTSLGEKGRRKGGNCQKGGCGVRRSAVQVQREI